MTLSTTKPNTTPPTLTPIQIRVLIYTLVLISRDARLPATVETVPQQPLQRNITIDASNRMVGHRSSVGFGSPSSTEQAVKIQEALHGILQPMSQVEKKGTAIANVNLLDIIIHTGIKIIGSRNVIVSNSGRNVSRDATKVTAPLTERKRKAGFGQKATDIQTTREKKVKVEEY